MTTLRRHDRRHGCSGGGSLISEADRLSFVRRKGNDVDKLQRLRVVSGFGEDDPAVRTTYQHHRTCCLRDDLPGSRHTPRKVDFLVTPLAAKAYLENYCYIKMDCEEVYVERVCSLSGGDEANGCEQRNGETRKRRRCW
jgi:hypothetical protein